MTELQAVLELEPQNLNYQFRLAGHYLSRGRFEEARPIVEDMMSIHPENSTGSRMVAATMFDFLNEAWVMGSNNEIECGLFRPVPVVGGNGLKKHRAWNERATLS